MAEPTKEKATEPKADTVTVRCLQPFTNPNTQIVMIPGQTCEVTRDQAAQLTKEISGSLAFRGERYAADGDVKRHSHRRAQIVEAQA